MFSAPTYASLCLDWLLWDDSYWVQSEVKRVGQLEKQVYIYTNKCLNAFIFTNMSTFWRTELSFSQMRKTRISKKTFFFLSDTTEWEMFISVNQCHSNGNKKTWFNYVSCILKCGQLWFALVALRGQCFGGEKHSDIAFFTTKLFDTWLRKNIWCLEMERVTFDCFLERGSEQPIRSQRAALIWGQAAHKPQAPLVCLLIPEKLLFVLNRTSTDEQFLFWSLGKHVG